MARPEWIEVGRVSRAHGVNGEVRVVPSSDNPDRFAPGSVLYCRPERMGLAGPRLREQGRLTVESLRGDDAFPIIAFEEITDRNAAEGFRGYILEIPSSQLPELEDDEYYPFDLVGLEARGEDGRVLGRVSDAVESPAHALLVIRLSRPAADEAAASAGGIVREDQDEMREILLPFVQEVIPLVDVPAGYLVVAAGVLE